MAPMWIVLALLPILGGAERFNCRTRILGAYYADAISGCKAFHVCVRVAGGGIRDFRFFCPPGTLFHQEAQTCTDWGDDDPLACPAEIYDGQFDLYKIGSGFDTKKLSATANRDEESEFGLQRAETGDRRLSQSQGNPSGGASDLRAAHSSDFFSGQRERGRDESIPAQSTPASPRQSFRRTTTSRPYSFSQTQSTLQHSTPSAPPQPSSPAQFDPPKRKLVRKRPIYVSTQAPSTFAQDTQPAQPFSEQPQQQYQQQQQRPKQQQFYRQPQQKTYEKKQYQEQTQKQETQQQPQQQQQQYQQPPKQQYQQQEQYQQQSKQQQQPKTQQQYQQQSPQSNRQIFQQQRPQQQQPQQQQPQQQQPQHQQQQQQQPQQQQQQYQQQPKQLPYQPQQQHQQQPQQQQYQQQTQSTQQQTQPQTQRNNNFENASRRPVSQNKQTTPPPSVPAQYKEYKDEYVEVSRVTPKQGRYFASVTTSAPFSQTTAAPFSKKDGLVELYNYDSQSTPGLNIHNGDRPFKIRNSFSVSEIPQESDFARTKSINFKTTSGRSNPTTLDYNTAATRTTPSDPASRNYNSVSYEPEKSSFVPFSKQNYFNNPSTTPGTTTFYTSTRPDPPPNLNTVAYNTNIGFNVPSNFGNEGEDDGQYHLPEGEDDGKYKPEIYDRELLSGAHSLNIAASGNRLPEDQKPRDKTQSYVKSSQTAVPRPFRPAPTPTSSSIQSEQPSAQTTRPSTQTTRLATQITRLSTQTTRPPTQTTRFSEPTYTTTVRPPTTNTQRTFDYYQTYTTTSRPNEASAPVHISLNFDPIINGQARPTTSSHHKNLDPRPPPPPTVAPPKQSTRPPYFANPASHKEDSSYDYAYYDSDPGFSEYDHIEEFGRTNRKA